MFHRKAREVLRDQLCTGSLQSSSLVSISAEECDGYVSTPLVVKTKMKVSRFSSLRYQIYC